MGSLLILLETAPTAKKVRKCYDNRFGGPRYNLKSFLVKKWSFCNDGWGPEEHDEWRRRGPDQLSCRKLVQNASLARDFPMRTWLLYLWFFSQEIFKVYFQSLFVIHVSLNLASNGLTSGRRGEFFDETFCTEMPTADRRLHAGYWRVPNVGLMALCALRGIMQ